MSGHLNSIWQGAFTLFGVEVKCHVLNDGQRIIEADSFADLLRAMNEGGAECSQEEMDAFAKWQRGEA